MTEETSTLKVVYITGVTRSGSGVLGRLLSLIEGSTFAGELRRVWSRGFRPGRTCGCGRPHGQCPVWTKVLLPGTSFAEPTRSEIARIQRRVAPDRLDWLAALRALRLPNEPDPDTPHGRYLRAYTELHRAVAAATGASLLIDSSKHASDAALLTLRRDPPTFLIHLIRDPRGVVSRLQQNSGRRSRLARTGLALRGSIRWLGKHLANERVRRRLGDGRSIALRYEDLAADPARAVRAVAELVGRPAPRQHLAPRVAIAVPEVHGADGSRRRRFEAPEIVVELDARWHRELAPVDRWLVTVLTYPLLRRYGYPVRVPAR
jgi:hypothetical protein